MSLAGKVALVAGATRGAGRGIAVELGAAGATVYVTGRTTRERRSEYDRPETIEETAELVNRAGGEGIAVPVDHLVPEQVRALVDRIRADHGRLDVLVNDIWGGELLVEWDKPVWEHDLANGLRMLHLAIDTHLITAHFALPLLIQRPGGLLVEVTDGTADYNATNYRLSPFYDLAKVAVNRMALAHAQGPREARGDRAVADARLAALGDDARPFRRHRGKLARRHRRSNRTSPSPRRPASSAAPSQRWPPTRIGTAGTASPCQAAASPRSTASPTSTDPARTPALHRRGRGRGKPADTTGYR